MSATGIWQTHSHALPCSCILATGFVGNDEDAAEMDLQQMLAWHKLSICVPLQCTMNLLSQVDTLALPCLS